MKTDNNSTPQGMSFADEIEAAKIESGKKFIKSAAYVVFGATVIFLGIFNFMLYARAFDDPATKLLAILPAVTISGSVLLLTFANIRWFSMGTQAQVGKFAGYGLFAIEAANAVVEWTLVNNWLDSSAPVIRIYAQFGIPLALVLIGLVYKILIDSDEESEIVREHNMTSALIRQRKRAAQMAFLDDATIKTRITRAGQDAARRLTAAHTVGVEDEPAQLPAASFAKDAEGIEDDGAADDSGEGEDRPRPLE